MSHQPTVSWFRGHTSAELLAALKPRGLALRQVTPGRLVFSGGPGPVEAWKAGRSWLVGDPSDLVRLADAAALEVTTRP